MSATNGYAAAPPTEDEWPAAVWVLPHVSHEEYERIRSDLTQQATTTPRPDLVTATANAGWPRLSFPTDHRLGERLSGDVAANMLRAARTVARTTPEIEAAVAQQVQALSEARAVQARHEAQRQQQRLDASRCPCCGEPGPGHGSREPRILVRVGSRSASLCQPCASVVALLRATADTQRQEQALTWLETEAHAVLADEEPHARTEESSSWPQ